MKPGTIVKLDDGRVGTVVLHGLTGYGVKLGRHKIPQKDIDLILSTPGDMHLIGVNCIDAPPDFEWLPDVTGLDERFLIVIEGPL